MPFRNPEDRRRYDRERRRRLRAGQSGTLAVPEEVRVRVAEDLELLLGEAVALVRSDQKARGIEKARVLGYLVSIGLRLIETRDLTERMEALERVLQLRRIG